MMASGRQELFLYPGEVGFGGPDLLISTLLGSCVSITLWHPLRHLGGMCHYQVAQRNRPPGSPPDGRFGDEAFEILMRHVAESGTRPGEYQAKLFGGGAMYASASGDMLDVGLRNVEKGYALLDAARIPLVAEHVGGSGRRKLHFDLGSGDVWLAFPDGRGAVARTGLSKELAT